MEFTHCFGCMEHTPAYPCPHCGYDPNQESPPYALRPGTILHGRYVVGKILGQGGFGITYIGWNLALDSKVAIKEYYPSGQVMRDQGASRDLHWFTSDQARWAQTDGLERFVKEARKMSKVSNLPQVVQVQDLFQENDTAYIVMEFIAGMTLKAQLADKGPMTWEQGKDIFLPAVRTMEQVHQFGLIHRDLSPDNLMIQPDGQVKILDLGAAKDLTVNSGVSSMQVAKSGFSPLEQYQAGGTGTWTDVYAMAATMYYAFTGTIPPAAIDRMEDDHIRWDLPGFQSLPTPVRIALIQGLAVRPKERPQTMSAFLALLDPNSQSAPPVVPEEPPKEAPQGSPKTQAADQKEQYAPSAPTPRDEEEPDPPAVKEKKPAQKRPFWLIWLAAACLLVCVGCIFFSGEDALLETTGGGLLFETTHEHSWVDATCTSPKTCSTCGETEGDVVHQWEAATCTSPKTCSLCGETEGNALGHDWEDATYSAPKTCSRCGETDGNPLGYLEYMDGSYAQFTWNSSTVHKYVFDQSVKNCSSFLLYYKPTFSSGCYVSNWRVLIQDTSGNWHSDYTFTLDETDYCHTIKLSPKISIQAVAVVPTINGSYSWTSSMGIFDIHYEE